MRPRPTGNPRPRIGILAVQGAFAEHEQALIRVGVEATQVRLPLHLAGLDGLIIPGGESTTIGQVSQRWDLIDPIRAFASSGRPLWGTCAGLIVMASEVLDGIPGQPLLDLMDISVRRQAFGRQVDSFEADLSIPQLGDTPFHAIFIRAPAIECVGPDVDVLARLDDESIVAVQQGHLLATAFHPELTRDDRFHQYFVGLAA
jgi:5'-phosphate synthase pdxT subunit